MSTLIAIILHLAAAVAALVAPAPTPPVYEDCAATEVVVLATDDPASYDTGCDLTPPQRLTVVIGAEAWGDHETWGSDASVEWAQRTCEDLGGTPVWVTNPHQLRCTDRDY